MPYDVLKLRMLAVDICTFLFDWYYIGKYWIYWINPVFSNCEGFAIQSLGCLNALRG